MSGNQNLLQEQPRPKNIPTYAIVIFMLVLVLVCVCVILLGCLMLLGEEVNIVTNNCTTLTITKNNVYVNETYTNDLMKDYILVKFGYDTTVPQAIPILQDPYRCQHELLSYMGGFVGMYSCCAAFANDTGSICLFHKEQQQAVLWMPGLVFYDVLTGYAYNTQYASSCDPASGKGYCSFDGNHQYNLNHLQSSYEKIYNELVESNVCVQKAKLSYFTQDDLRKMAITIFTLMGSSLTGIFSLLCVLGCVRKFCGFLCSLK